MKCTRSRTCGLYIKAAGDRLSLANLEHGVEVSRRDGKWTFGYFGDNMDYFHYWENGV